MCTILYISTGSGSVISVTLMKESPVRTFQNNNKSHFISCILGHSKVGIKDVHTQSKTRRERENIFSLPYFSTSRLVLLEFCSFMPVPQISQQKSPKILCRPRRFQARSEEACIIPTKRLSVFYSLQQAT